MSCYWTCRRRLRDCIVTVLNHKLEKMQARITDPESSEALKHVARGTFINVARAFGVLVNREYSRRCALFNWKMSDVCVASSAISRQAYDQSLGLEPLQFQYYMPESIQQMPIQQAAPPPPPSQPAALPAPYIE